MKKAFLFVVIFSFSLSSKAQLTGQIKNNFVKATQEACFKVQRAGNFNNQQSDATLQQWCRCTTAYLSDSLTNQVINEIEQGKRSLSGIPQLNNLAATYCAKDSNYKKY